MQRCALMSRVVDNLTENENKCFILLHPDVFLYFCKRFIYIA